MKDDYADTFNTRGDLYNEASQIDPLARSLERQILIDLLAVSPSHRICDAPAGGGYLADGLRGIVSDASQLICVEPSVQFAAAISADYTQYIAPLDSLPLADDTVDRVGSLAGLHHLHSKQSFFNEAARVLKPQGRFAVGDVMADTRIADFLNGPVDQYTETGHLGIFLKSGECENLMKKAGFSSFREEYRPLPWTFGSLEQLTQYCQTLFGMVKATHRQVKEAILDCLEVEQNTDRVLLQWGLLYGVATA